MKQRTEEILENVVWFISQFDDATLKEVQHLPFLEMAKAASIFAQTPLPQRSKIYRTLGRLSTAGQCGPPFTPNPSLMRSRVHAKKI